MSRSEPPRRFPPPWKVERASPGCFLIKDANGFSVAHVYCRDDLRATGYSIGNDCLTSDEARRIATAIARIPEFMLAGRQFSERGQPANGRWNPRRPFHIALRDAYVRENYDYIVAMCRYNDVPFDATGEKISREGLWCVYEFAFRVDAAMFWQAFDGRWLLGEAFHYPADPDHMPKMKPIPDRKRFQGRDNGWV